MYLFAHNGVDHATAGEAVTHSAAEVLAVTLVMTVLAIGLMATLVYGLHRLKWIEIPIKERKQK